jgi:uncharacterized protein YjbI with pentapeptide repeats
MIRRIFRRLLLSLLVSLFVPSLGGAALATSCLNVDIAPEDFLREVDMLFEGELVHQRAGDVGSCSQGCVISTFRVTSPLKGLLGETVEIASHPLMLDSDSRPLITSPTGQLVTIAAYRDETGVHYSGVCSQYIVGQGQNSDAIRKLAYRNLGRTLALTAPAGVTPDRRLLIKSLHWLSEYRSHEEGLVAAEQLLALDPNDRDGLDYKARFLSALNRDAEALKVANQLLALNASDLNGLRQRAIALIRLGRMSEVSADWRDFDGLEADSVDFSGRDLAQASFRGARLTEVNFKNVNLSSADFTGAILDRSDLSDAELTDVSFVGAEVSSTFHRSNLMRADFDQASGHPDFTGATLTDAVFTSAELAWVKFDDAKARGANLAGACMRGSFLRADLTDADLREAVFMEATWTGAILRNVDLRGGTLESYLEDSDITGMRFDDRTYPARDAGWEKRGAIKVANARLGEPYRFPCPY